MNNFTSQDIARGISRYLRTKGFSPMCEVSFENSRRVDVAGLDANGRNITISAITFTSLSAPGFRENQTHSLL